MSTLEEQVIDGTILSDANLSIPRGGENAVYLIALSGREHLDWLYYIKDALEALDVVVTPSCPRVHVRIGPTGKPYDYCCLQTRVSSFLTHQFYRWYRDGKKEVPRDLFLTPVSLANWFMGDGTSPEGTRGIKTSFATHGFPASSIELLEHLLSGLGFHVSSTKVGIYLYQDGVDNFMKLVEPFVLPSYRYKIKYRRKDGGSIRP